MFDRYERASAERSGGLSGLWVGLVCKKRPMASGLDTGKERADSPNI